THDQASRILPEGSWAAIVELDATSMATVARPAPTSMRGSPFEGSRPDGPCSEGIEDQQEVPPLFRARTAGPATEVDQDGRPLRVSRRQRRRDGTGASRFAMGGSLLARVVHLVVSVIVLIIVVGIVLVLLKANASNSIVSEVHDWARSLAGPFDGIFSFDNAHVAIAVNWGIAAVVYSLAGGLIARLIGGTRR